MVLLCQDTVCENLLPYSNSKQSVESRNSYSDKAAGKRCVTVDFFFLSIHAVCRLKFN